MHHKKIVFLDAYTNNPGDISFDHIAVLGDLHVYDRTGNEQLESRAAGAEIVIVNKFLINERSLAMMPDVRYIVVGATGYNNIDIDAVRQAKICVSNVKGYSTASVTQHVFAAIFALMNRLEYYDTQVKAGKWSRCPDFCFYEHSIREISGMTLGIMGLGAIGSSVAKVAHAFGMHVIATTRKNIPEKADIATIVDVNTLFSQSDILTLHCPLTAETKEIINRNHLKMMKNSAVLINTGRGGLVNEADLFYALDHGLIAGAALDVLQNEPPHITHPLIMHHACLVSPHVAWASRESRIRLLEGIGKNISSYLEGIWINRLY